MSYYIRRALQIIPMMVVISILVFFLVRATGDPLAMYAGNPNLSAEEREQIYKNFGLDKPLHIQYLTWAKNMLKGDWGNSFATGRPVKEMILERVPNSLILMGAAFVLSVAIGMILGIYSAIHQYSKTDFVSTVLAMLGFATPIFWLGMMAIIIFSVYFREWGLPSLPAGGMYDLSIGMTLGSVAKHLILPSIVISFIDMAPYIRYLRTGMLDVLKQDYVRTARAMGFKEKTVIYKYALRNALRPVSTIIFMRIPVFFGGAMITEQVFAWPGMGRLFWEHAQAADFPVLVSALLLVALAVMICNLIADFVYALLDPRVKYS